MTQKGLDLKKFILREKHNDQTIKFISRKRNEPEDIDTKNDASNNGSKDKKKETQLKSKIKAGIRTPKKTINQQKILQNITKNITGVESPQKKIYTERKSNKKKKKIDNIDDVNTKFENIINNYGLNYILKFLCCTNILMEILKVIYELLIKLVQKV